MPAGTGGASGSNTNANPNRAVFRPPWVKEGPQPIPVPSAPWALKNREGKPEEATQPPKFPQLRKTSGPNVQSKENGQPVPHIEQVQLRPTPKETRVTIQTEPKEIPITLKREDSTPQQRTLRETKERPIPIQKESLSTKPPAVRRERPPLVTKKSRAFDDEDIPSSHTLRKQDSILNIIPPAPPAPPAPPLPPPQPKVLPDGYKPISSKAAKVLESLRQRPRARPDWGSLLKDVEQGRKLNHVVCNDRSKPLLPGTKAKTKDGEKFVYDSEKQKSNPHNLLLKEIQSGVRLRRVETNDRSKPILDGLRKFRRQMTIEEQIQKSQSSVKLGSTPDNQEEIITDDEDEMDDIDKLRDDLQSTKQLLALELRNVEAHQKENKRLQARIANLEVELDHERGKAAASVTRSVLAERMEDDQLVQSLKQEVEDARKAAKDAEKKYIKCSDELDTVKGELDESKRQNEILQKKLDAALKALSGRRESQAVPNAGAGAGEEPEDEPMEGDESESEEDDGDDTEEKREKRAKREIKMLVNKLKHVKTKKENARKERQSLKEQMKKEQRAIKDERKKYKHLQREVDKMAELMNTDEDAEEKEKDNEDVEDDEEAEELIGEEEETSESESESSSESEDEEEQSESESEDAPFDKRKDNYTSRVRRYENQLAALKKGNYLLKANIDRLRDDINKQRTMSLQLQQDLDSILNDLG